MKLLTKFKNDHTISQDYLEKMKQFFNSRGIPVKIEDVGGPSISDSWSTIYVWVSEENFAQAEKVLQNWYSQ